MWWFTVCGCVGVLVCSAAGGARGGGASPRHTQPISMKERNPKINFIVAYISYKNIPELH